MQVSLVKHMKNNFNILIVDDHPAVRLAVKYVLNAAGYSSVQQAASSKRHRGN